MKSNLYFPETANFSNDWQFVCNLFYTSVQGYVDSKSPQGGIIRNEFEFIYYSFAGEKLLALVSSLTTKSSPILVTSPPPNWSHSSLQTPPHRNTRFSLHVPWLFPGFLLYWTPKSNTAR